KAFCHDHGKEGHKCQRRPNRPGGKPILDEPEYKPATAQQSDGRYPQYDDALTCHACCRLHNLSVFPGIIPDSHHVNRLTTLLTTCAPPVRISAAALPASLTTY